MTDAAAFNPPFIQPGPRFSIDTGRMQCVPRPANAGGFPLFPHNRHVHYLRANRQNRGGEGRTPISEMGRNKGFPRKTRDMPQFNLGRILGDRQRRYPRLFCLRENTVAHGI